MLNLFFSCLWNIKQTSMCAFMYRSTLNKSLKRVKLGHITIHVRLNGTVWLTIHKLMRHKKKTMQFSNFLQVWFCKNNRIQIRLDNRELKGVLTHSAWLHRVRFLNVKMVNARFLAGRRTSLGIIQVRSIYFICFMITVFIKVFLFKYQKLALQFLFTKKLALQLKEKEGS
jgi:hypothetical protein